MKIAFAAVLVAAFGCSNKGDERMRDLATRVNPVFASLRGPASIVLDANKRSDVPAITKACLQGIALAKPLSTIDFKDEFVGNDRQSGINDVLYLFSHDVPTYCPDAHQDTDCAEWCVKRYDELADAVDRLRDQAARKSVQIQSLRK